MNNSFSIGSVMESYITDGEFAQVFPEVALESVYPYNTVDVEVATEASAVATWVSNAYRVLQTLRNKIQMFIAEHMLKLKTLMVETSFRKKARNVADKAYNGNITDDDLSDLKECLTNWKDPSGKMNRHLSPMPMAEAKTIMNTLLKAIDVAKRNLASVKDNIPKEDVGGSAIRQTKGARRDDIVNLNRVVNLIVSGISKGISAGKKLENADTVGSKENDKMRKRETAERKKAFKAAIKDEKKQNKSSSSIDNAADES